MNLSLISKIIQPIVQIWPQVINTYLEIQSSIDKEPIFRWHCFAEAKPPIATVLGSPVSLSLNRMSTETPPVIRLRDGNSVTVGTYKFCKVHLSNDKFTCLYSFLLLFPRTISFFSLFHNFIPICHQTATFVLVSSPVRL